MNEIKHGHNPDDHPDNSGNHHDARPYWKRTLRCARFWVAVFLMLAAMIIYVMSGDLSAWHRGQPRQPIAAPAGN
ncbi:MAG TPA: hypothetical protein VN048_12950 [Verrucomicrobiae bacterium]|jgi:hypothetical protein|nr:hypothetical protein [Verrucomicrobiae bacterium]